MQPAFKELSQVADLGVNVAELDCTTHKAAAAQYGVRGYPTLKFFKDGVEIDYDSPDRTLTAMQLFVTGVCLFLHFYLILVALI
jgi:hypothetical protein